jgi:hypothetical protein
MGTAFFIQRIQYSSEDIHSMKLDTHSNDSLPTRIGDGAAGTEALPKSDSQRGRPRKWLFRLLVLLPISVVLVGGIVLAVWAIPVFGPMKPESADLWRLQQWLVLRDFSEQSPEVQRALLKRFTTLLGPASDKEPVVELSEMERKYAADFGAEDSLAEQNARLMVQLWFRERAESYHIATKIEKRDILDSAAEEMDWWEKFYFDYLEEVGEHKPTVVDMLSDLNTIMESIQASVSKEEYERVATFNQQLQARIVQQKAVHVLEKIWSPFKKKNRSESPPPSS